MTFASTRQIVTLTIVVAALFFAIDRIENPRRAVVGSELTSPPLVTEKPTIRLGLNHLCCGGCLTALEEALTEIPWIEVPKVLKHLPSLEQAKTTPGVVTEYRQEVMIDIKDPERNLKNVDFVAILSALRKAGFTAAQMELSGIPHYRLQAELPHMCCPACAGGTRESMDGLVRAGRAQGSFRWFDSYSVERVNHSLVIYPRLNSTVDMMEVLGAINTMGFEARSLTVEVQGG